MSDAGPYKYATRIVRVFHDYAESVIWFPDPVLYEDSRLTTDLVDGLRSWDAQYYSELTDDFRWRSLDALHSFNRDGLELARRVAVEIGSSFGVEYRSFENGVVAELRSDQPAINPDAEGAFQKRAQEAQEEWAAIRARAVANPAAQAGRWGLAP
ncbi:hypothetical protein [Microbacterium terregens]|jgi:hypothetical protein|uniref:Uncharacterized protein n=1 Tax=Microbacterium terregens TaxID=69363 RepID=A0ABV5T1S5_9MICO